MEIQNSYALLRLLRRANLKGLLLACLIVGFVLVGCGGGSGQTGANTVTSATTGRAQLSVRWPDRNASRLIPFAANSIRVRLLSLDGVRLLAEQVVTRPETGNTASVFFDRLPIGPLNFVARAFPGSDGSGVAQANGQVQATIIAGQTAEIRLTLASTIDTVEVMPATASLAVGQTRSLVATAKNQAGEVVLTDASTFLGESSNPSVATVTSAGLVTAIGVGVATLTITEAESGKFGTCTVTVTEQSPTELMYVSSFYTHNIQRYDSVSGAFTGSFIPTESGGLHLPHKIVFGPDNLVYVSTDDSGVRRYNATTGAPVDTFISASSGGLSNAVGMLFGKDGNLLVCSAWSNEVKRYNAQTGAFIDNFISGNGLNLPHDLVFGPDGKLYVCSSNSSEVKRYDADTGAFLGNFVSGGSGGLAEPNSLVFGADGNLYVSSFATHEIKRYNGTTGAFLGNFVTAQSGGLDHPVGLAFGPDVNLYVVSKGTNTIKRYNGTTGAYLGDMDPTNTAGLVEPWGITFH